MLRDFIGTDVAKMYNEVNKMALILGPGAMITPEAIERNVGISKDFNKLYRRTVRESRPSLISSKVRPSR